MTSGGQAKLDRDAIFWHFPGYLGAGPGSGGPRRPARSAPATGSCWSSSRPGKLELYNLRDDLGEKTDLAGAMPDRVKELHARMLAWRKQVGAPMPGRNP